jgi:hypothetical protein
MMFQAWAQNVLRTMVEAYATENARLGKVVGKKADSLWMMNKEELMEKARKDLGMNPTTLAKETVTSLRERLRSQKDVVEMLTDPLAKAPKGLDNMLKNELQQECLLRDINIPDPCTRPRMIVLIKDDVAVRLTLETQGSADSVDWEMTEANVARRRVAR